MNTEQNLNAAQVGGSGLNVELERLVRTYESERDNEADRFYRDETNPYISAWNPRFTMQMSAARRDRMKIHMKNWTIAWWGKNGYKVKFSDACDGFNVEPLSL